MKNTYIIALKDGNCPHLIKKPPYYDICGTLSFYKKAYIIENKKKADEMRADWYNTRRERKDDENYPDFY